ncbi:MAG: nucleotidyltransferase domain-containing protein [Nitrososphaerales archaeon]
MRSKVIKEAIERASSLPYRATATLIGSYARGDFNLWSDVDIVLIADFKGNPLERLKLIDAPYGFQIIPLMKEEFLRLLERRNPIAVEVVQNGIILRDDFGINKLIKSAIK